MKKILSFVLLTTILSCSVEDGIDGLSVGLFSNDLDNGCTKLSFFQDLNLNGIFDEEEQIISEFDVCDGIDGVNGKDGISVGSKIEDLDENCKSVTYFKDLNGDFNLDEGDEIITTITLCNGSDGVDGMDGKDGEDGVDGVSAKIFTSASNSCSEGGTQFSIYLDSNSNNSFDEGETILSEFSICNGADGINGTDGTDGSDGANGADGADATQLGIRVRDASSEECSSGGRVFEFFYDSNKNGQLDSGEEIIEKTLFCNTPTIRSYIEGKTFIASIEDAEGDYLQIMQVSLNSSTIKLYNTETLESECYSLLQDYTIVNTTPNNTTEWRLIAEGKEFFSILTITTAGDTIATFILENDKIKITQTLDTQVNSNTYEIYSGSIPATQCVDD